MQEVTPLPSSDVALNKVGVHSLIELAIPLVLTL
jgi:hypothetical protein